MNIIKNIINKNNEECIAAEGCFVAFPRDLGRRFTDSNIDYNELGWYENNSSDHQIINSKEEEDEGEGGGDKLNLSPKQQQQQQQCCNNNKNKASSSSGKPISTFYISSGDVKVNSERAKHNLRPLTRRRSLDDIARQHAKAMADSGLVRHTEPGEVQEKLGKPSRRLGENIAHGSSVAGIHRAMMKRKSDANNILDSRFNQMGTGTATNSDGIIFACHVFRS